MQMEAAQVNKKTRSQEVDVSGHRVKLTNLDKVLWPDAGYTKGDLINYYAKVAQFILPHLQRRPLTVVRYPNGIDGKSFYQKNAPASTPEFVDTVTVGQGDDQINYILASNPATLVWLANQAALELHPWLSTTDHPEQPDVVIFDLDPAEGSGFDDAREIAFIIKAGLDELALIGYPKLSGATGIHIYVPIEPKYSYQITSSFVGFLGKLMTQLYPAKITNERLVKNRTGRVYIDHLQNLFGKTIVSVYSPRPNAGAPVSVPVTWDELEKSNPGQFNIVNAVDRLQQVGDLFAPVLTHKQSLDHILPQLGL